MAKNNAEYWADRMKVMEDKILDEAYKDVENLEKQYTLAIKDIEDKINAWYQRLADNNGVSLAEAKKLLTKDELEEFHWTVEQYIERGMGLVDGNWEKQLENASARVHISRLEYLEMQLQQHAEELTGHRINVTTDAAKTSYTESYYHTAFEMQKYAEMGVKMQKINPKELEKMLSRPWTVDDVTFSSRIWTDRNKLVNLVNKELTRMCATGAKPDEAIKNIKNAFNTSKANAGRVVMTESAYFASAARKDCYDDLDVEYYEVISGLDAKVCDECGEQDTHTTEHPYKMSEYEIGVTAPPFHPWCRCTTVPWKEEMVGIGDRWMRDPETGKGGYVPSDMSYKEWKEIYVDKTSTMDEWKAMRVDKSAESGKIGTGLPVNIQLFARKSSDFQTVRLPKDEYAHVMSEIATNLTEKQSQKPFFSKAIGNFYYTVENKGFGNYRVIGKVEIE